MSKYSMQHRFFAILLLLVSNTFLPASSALAQTPRSEDSDVTPCISYNPESKRWGRVGVEDWSDNGENCPRNYAYIATKRGSGSNPKGQFIPVSGTCCPLPKDALTETHVYKSTECPAGYVATGAKPETIVKDASCGSSVDSCSKAWSRVKQLMRCTKVNDKRYKLSQARAGYILGWEKHFSTIGAKRTTRSRLPLSIRYAVSRVDKTHWDKTACIGYPFGGLLTAKLNKYCAGFQFSQLQYIGIPGDPSSGTAVDVAPPCQHLEDRFNPDTKCTNLAK